MSALLPPSAKARKGILPPLQPTFFTSSLFVNPLREDIDALFKDFIRRCKIAHNASEAVTPFQWFKVIWKEQKWHLLHLRCISARPRKTFLETVFRLFLERAISPEPVLNRLAALFSIYIFFRTQPDVPDHYRLSYIPIAIDHYQDLISLPAALPPTFDHYSTHIIQLLVKDSVFVLLPPSTFDPYSPTILPHTTVALIPEPTEAILKRGRPTAADIERRTIRAVDKLDAWGTTNSMPATVPAPESSDLTNEIPPYARAKIILRQTVSSDVIEESERSTLAKMKQLEQDYQNGGFALLGTGTQHQTSAGIQSAERAVEMEGGLLDLTQAIKE